MIDEKVRKFIAVLLDYSCEIKCGENILISAGDLPPEILAEFITSARGRGANVFTDIVPSKVKRAILQTSTEDSLKIKSKINKHTMKYMDAYINIFDWDNCAETSDVSSSQMELWNRFITKKDTDYLKKKWCVVSYPTSSMAQNAGMSTEQFKDFFFKVCCLNYAAMDNAMKPLWRLMNQTDKVCIKGPGTDLSFSIKNIGTIKCSGQNNIPDGEIYTAPVKHSVNGVVQFNTETVYQGTTFSNIRLEFSKGKIVKATGSDTVKLNAILDTDPGARYVGEFALGLNPFITKPMKDILFDEKIAGSFHFTPGAAYANANNGNKSSIHWDMVNIQTPKYGGGEIYFDGNLIRKDGDFTSKDLIRLNPENQE